ncbi:MAG: PKD domain-containing protein [Bacteroidetes bacterium]|mgnify:CR=1 FL=1|nr:MAG: PKD domain-containing protein [Bacteroidota bacterium]REK33427.1 MAG: PKD domain-containing protein [Bacteroidota bacterium]REK49826.1 MAG: PKD domain-containing protein [Bacteroidota bacterium]
MRKFYPAILLLFISLAEITVQAQEIIPDNSENKESEHIPKYKTRIQGALNEEGKKQDRPDLAAEYDAQITKDPKTGKVHKERLKDVFNIIHQQRLNRVRQPANTSASTATWVERGPSNVGGRTRALMYDPNDATNKKVWAGGVGGGLWYTNDITVTNPVWVNVNDFWANIAISCIAYNPANTQEFYVGTGEGWYNADAIQGMGIWKTTDGGNTWNQLSSTNNSTFQHVQKIVVTATGEVYAATRSTRVQRSVNGGASWTTVVTNSSTTRAADLEIGADGTLYASMGIFTTDGIYSSTNGTTWTKLNTGANGFPTSGFERIEIACAPSDANVLYALTQENVNDGIGQIYKSVDKGATWTTQNKPTDADLGIGTDFTRGQAWYDLIAAVDPFDSQKLIIGGISLFYSTNSGSTWTQISKWSNNANQHTLLVSLVHADQHAIVFQPGSSSVFIVGNDGGVYRCNNVTLAGSSSQFSSKNSGYNVTQFYACAINPTAGSNNFLAGAQDNGTQKFNSAGMNSTTQVTGGDGAFCFIDQTNGNYQISSYVYNYYWRTTNNWSSSTIISNNTSTGSFINPTDYDDANGILYSAYSTTQVQRISGIRATPSSPAQITITGMNSMATHLRVSQHSPAGTTTLFVGTGNGKVFKVENAHTSTPTITSIGGASFPTNGSVSCIEVGSTENDLLVTFSNYGVVSVWRTTNGGGAWSNKEGNLPDMPVRWVIFNPNNMNEVLLATEVGVWSTSDINAASPVWVANNNNLANVRVTQLHVRNSDKMLIASTHGRGVFTTDYIGLPQVDFTASSTSVCAGDVVNFTDQSPSSPTSWNWSFPGGTPSSSTQQNPVVIYNTPGVYSVTLVAGSGSNTKSNYITVSENPVSVSISASPSDNICPGTNVNFTATPVNGGTPSYQWKLNGTNVGTNSSSYSNNALNNGDQISVVMTSTISCAVGNPATSNIITMTVNSNAPGSVSISASPSGPVCQGTNVTFTANPVNAGVPSYQWKVDGTNVGTNSSTYSTVSLNNGESVSCEISYTPPCFGLQSVILGTGTTTNTTSSVTAAAYPTYYGNGRQQYLIRSIDLTNLGLTAGDIGAIAFNINGTVGNPATLNGYTIKLAHTSVTTLTSTMQNPTFTTVFGPLNYTPLTNQWNTHNFSQVFTWNGSSNLLIDICFSNQVTGQSSYQNFISAAGYTGTAFYRADGTGGAGACTANTGNGTSGNRPNMTITKYPAPTTSVSNNIVMSVNTAAAVSVSIAASPSSNICAGTSVTFTATPVNGGTPNYQWKRNGTNVGTNSPTFSSSTLNNNDQISCVMTSTESCVSGNPATSNIITMTVSSSPTASVSISASPSGAICNGTNVTFTASPANGGTPSYQWKLNGTNVGTNSPTYSNNTLSNADAVSCVMTSSLACVTGNPATSNTITMTVNPLQTVSVSIAASPAGAICAGTSVTFTATPVNGGSPAYQWKLNGSNVGSNSSTYTNSSLSNNDQITCMMTSTVNCPSGNPATSNAITMTVNPVLTASVSIAASPSNNICSGTNVTFTATPVNGGTPSYQWKLNGTNVGTNSPTYSNGSLANGNQISCVMTSSETCVSGSPANSNAISMTVTQTVTPTITISAIPSFAVCSGTNVTFTSSISNGGSSPSYQWKRNGTNVGTNSSSYSNNALNHGDQIMCILTSNATCTSGNPANSNTITMTVVQTVPASVSISASPSGAICQGTNVTFTASPTNGGTPSYQWKLNGTNVGTNSASYSSSTLNNNDQVHCVMTSNLPCVSGSPASSNIISMTVNPNLSVSVFISPTPSGIICAGSNVTFNASPTNGGSPSYQWKLNGGNVGSNSSTYNNNNLIDGDQVSCVMTSSHSCVTGNPASSNVLVAQNCSATLALKLFIEGFYTGNGKMRAVSNPISSPGITDTVLVSLANSSSPYSKTQSVKGIIDTSGNGSFTFNNVTPSSYYIVVEHRNALETWSATALPSAINMNYDFSDAITKAFGSMLKDIGNGRFALISGDINQDDIIDMSDLLLLELSVQNLESGYISSDLTGDRISESADFSLLENNIGLYIVQHP